MRRCRSELLAEMCAGHPRAGIALGGLQAGSAGLRAEAVEGGWLIFGTAPYVTGWSFIDFVLVAALTPVRPRSSLPGRCRRNPVVASRPLRLLAANASCTVRLHFDRHFVSSHFVTSIEQYTPAPSYGGGGRPNGSLALGVARRCLTLIGPSPLDLELDARRQQLDQASDETTAEARAAAAAFAVRAASALMVHQGSRSIFEDHHPQRLYREAAFLLVLGSRPSIRAALLRAFGAT